MSQISIRIAEEADTDEILEVLRLALGETALLKRTRDLWRWKHRDSPFGESIVLVATSDDRIIGVRAFMRWTLKTHDDDTIRCVRAVDTATHPEFHRRGIFRDLTMSALELARDDGVNLVFNTPNEKSAPGYLKMGWKEVAPIGVLARVRLGSSATRSDTPPSIEQASPCSRPFEEVMPQPKRRPPRGLRTLRDGGYLAWRFTQHPTVRYGWVADQGRRDDCGVVVRAGLRNGRPELVVSDLLGEPRPAVVRSTGRDTTCSYMAGWFSTGTPERKIAIRGGMMPVPSLKTLRLVANPLSDLPVDVYDIGSWDFATSDMELL